MNSKGETLIAYADCFSGVSGDMFLGALLDAGLELEQLQAEIEKLDLEKYTLRCIKQLDHAISSTRLEIKSSKSHTIRAWKDIRMLIGQSGLHEAIKEK